jgi:DNA-binding CsgD family transcriptional regulator
MEDLASTFSEPTCLSKGLCPPDPTTILPRVSSILHARHLEEAWDGCVAAMRALGFAHVVYGYSPDSRGTALGSPDDFLVLSTLDRRDMTEIVTRGHYQNSATFNWALGNAGVMSWSADPSEILPPGVYRYNEQTAALFARVGLHAGCSVGFRQARTRGVGAMVLSAHPGVSQEDVDRVLPMLTDTIFLLATVTHRALTGLPWQRPSGSLTMRQREVLEWVGEGKTTADIACIMGLTPATVEKHLRLARQCLGVDTTAHALIKATFLNQVYVRGAGRGEAS